MAWIEGTEKQSLVINAPLEQVVDFFGDPKKLQVCFTQLERAEEIEPGLWKWVLREKNEKGVKFQGTYSVRYEREGDDRVVWNTVGEGNMRSKGTVRCRKLGQKTEVDYEETIATDLPIPKLAAKVFNGIVAREIRKGVGGYLELVKSHLEKAHAGASR
ncbi:MAG: hypothetical protein H0U74_13390 [Bradymonadaceae bacterium]|nr:hypothetical protein [Lujinxingiaceae bacterium]